jgi:ubiquinone/menaquinone biosynthesis C-methylase UbiE
MFTAASVLVQGIIARQPDRIIDEIQIYDRADYNTWFEEEYQSNAEPWDYSKRGAEIVRHQYTLQKIRTFKPKAERLLELGCSRGLMTQQLAGIASGIVAADISLTAVRTCRKRCLSGVQKDKHNIAYFVTTVPDLPFNANVFDVVTLCDGLYGWWFSEENKKRALENVYQVLKPGGIAILTDCLMTRQDQMDYRHMAENSPLTVKEVTYLYDKPWYTLESFVQKTGTGKLLGRMLRSVNVADFLNKAGRLLGQRASRHICIVVEKKV